MKLSRIKLINSSYLLGEVVSFEDCFQVNFPMQIDIYHYANLTSQSSLSYSLNLLPSRILKIDPLLIESIIDIPDKSNVHDYYMEVLTETLQIEK